MPKSIIRSEMHALTTSHAQREDIRRTIAFYRRAVRMAATVAMTHWDELAPLRSKERQMALEAMFHATKDRPRVRYPVFDKAIGKMPSYLRRAALSSALGVVSSFLSNYSNFLDGEIGGKPRKIGARPPRLGYANVYPSLYGGNMILAGDKLKEVRVKLLSADGQWRFSAPMRLHGRMKRLPHRLDQAPSLIMIGEKVRLSCPVEVRPPNYLTNKAIAQGAYRVCAIDVGINTAATVAIVDTTGTVIARRFFSHGRHNDQRDRLAAEISRRIKQSGGLPKGKPFCSALHRRIAGLNLDAARGMAAQIAAFAREHDVKAIVVEDLKGWRPKGPSRAQRKRFHRFLHRKLIDAVQMKAQELGMRMIEIHARGTSRWAYDGSGKVVRSKENAQLARFKSGKRYNADLNGASNIAARGLATILNVKPCEAIRAALQNKAETGKSSGAAARMPLVLADIWAHVARLSAGTLTIAQSGKNGQ